MHSVERENSFIFIRAEKTLKVKNNSQRYRFYRFPTQTP